MENTKLTYRTLYHSRGTCPEMESTSLLLESINSTPWEPIASASQHCPTWGGIWASGGYTGRLQCLRTTGTEKEGAQEC